MQKLYKTLFFFIPLHFVTYLIMMLLWDGESQLILDLGNILTILGVFIALASSFLTYFYIDNKDYKGFWLILSLGIVCYFIAEMVWFYYETIKGGDFLPVWVDLFYIAHGLLFITMLIILAYKLKGLYSSFQLFLDMIITSSVVMIIGYHIITSHLTVLNSGYTEDIILSMIYVVISVTLLCGYFHVFLSKRININRGVSVYFMVGLGIFIFTDALNLYLSIQAPYYSSRWIDPFWVTGLLYVGMSGIKCLVTYEEVNEDRDTEGSVIVGYIRLLLPYAGVLSLILVMFARLESINNLLLGLGFTVLLIMVRQIMVMVQNKKLINSLKAANEELSYLNRYNKSTGLYNRAYFDEQLQRYQQSSELPISIMVCDLDGLKIINDTMGHHKGDQVLKRCSDILKSTMDKTDILARIGGDEFAAIMPKTDVQRTEEIVRKIKNRINNHNEYNKELPISISIGVATATSNIYLESLLKEADDHMYNEKLMQKKSSKSKILESLMIALEERDYITEGHAKRVAKYCAKIGEDMNLAAADLARLSLLAQVHDLGKVGIPDSILFKEGPLTEEEWKVMKQHPEKGYRIAVVSPELMKVADLILKHHERWDGNGYPLGLKELEIPVECRILSVVDSYDAIISKRPYKEARTMEEAITELKKYSGMQFDPEIVDVFLGILDREKKVEISGRGEDGETKSI